LDLLTLDLSLSNDNSRLYWNLKFRYCVQETPAFRDPVYYFLIWCPTAKLEDHPLLAVSSIRYLTALWWLGPI